MIDVKTYVFDFETHRIPISNLTIRRRLDSPAFCSVTIPNPDVDFDVGGGVELSLSDIINANPNGTLTISQKINGGSEEIVGIYTLNQVLSTESNSANTLVLNGIADFGTDKMSSGSYIIDNPLTDSNDSKGLRRFSAAENALIVVDDVITLRGVDVTVKEISMFVSTVNSRMDLGVV